MIKTTKRKKELTELTENEFNKLKEAGMLRELYPEAPESYNIIHEKGNKLYNSEELKRVTDEKNIKIATIGEFVRKKYNFKQIKESYFGNNKKDDKSYFITW